MLRCAFVLLALVVSGGTLAAQNASPSTGEVSLMPGDLIRVSIWREGDLSGDFLVDPQGSVVLPLLGEVKVTGTPLSELRDSLLAEYSRQLRNPSITITPLRRIYVLGEINRPGLLIVDPTVTLAGAIALAGGANHQGDLRKIQIVRDGSVIVHTASPTVGLTQLDIRSGDQILVGRRSWFDRNSTFLVSAILSVTSIVITLLK
jgi:polysaccharide export outer membrane protein